MIYLDNSATTALSNEAKEAMSKAMDTYGNPSSLHAVGLESHSLLVNARNQVAQSLGLRNLQPGQLIFTGCGTEASNLAIWGATHAKERRTTNTILTTDSEHPSVENVMRALEKEHWRVVRVSTKKGVLDMDTVKAELAAKDVFMISMMLVNNETGAVYPLEEVFRLAKESNPSVLTHCDAVQGYLKVKCQPLKMQADFMTISAHKVHGPKGVGALYVNADVLKKKNLVPVMYGGGQEFGFRSGTENLIGIAGFGAAAAIGYKNEKENCEKMQALRSYMIEKMSGLEVQMNLPEEKTAPHILNITLPHIKSETMLHYLSSKGICVSAGSACSSHAKTPSRSLSAFGLTAKEADSSLRISLCAENTKEEIDTLIESLSEGLSTLVRIR